MPSAAIRLTVRPTNGSNFNVSQTQPMLTSTTGKRSAHKFRPNKLCDSRST